MYSDSNTFKIQRTRFKWHRSFVLEIVPKLHLYFYIHRVAA